MGMTKYFIAGGAGFIGSNLAERILTEEKGCSVTVYDNLSSGKTEFLSHLLDRYDIRVIKADIKDLDQLKKEMKGCDIVYHLASNPDISKAIKQPDIDFWEGTYLASNVLEAMRVNEIKNLIYPSGSGVYGEVSDKALNEDHSPMLPISTYGASKLACEALICSYCHMFGMNAAAFRFANVVGPKQTHGVGYDFVRRLKIDPHTLEILGDGTQTKSYIYITDILDALRLIEKKHLTGFSYYNVATEDAVTVTEIADIAVSEMKLGKVLYKYTGGDRGWKGDVPKISLDSGKLRSKGWKNKYNSRQAIQMSIRSMIRDI